MAKANEQLEDILDDLSVIKNNNVAIEQRLGNIENILAKLATKEKVAPITPVASTSAASFPYDDIKSAVHEEKDSYFNAMSDSAELLSDKTLKRLGTIFIELYVEEIDKYLEKDEKERERKRNVYHGDYSNGILSFLALSPVFSFHLYIKVGLWILTEPTASFTRRSSWMKRERALL